MTRIVIAGTSVEPHNAEPHNGKPHNGEPHNRDAACLDLGRSLRDAGHEVVHAGTGPGPERLVATALAEDVDYVVLVPDGADDTGHADEVRRLLRLQHVDDVGVLVVGAGAAAAETLRQLGADPLVPPRDPAAG